MSKPIAVQGMTVISSDPTIVCTIAVNPPGQVICKATGTIHVDGDSVVVSAITCPSAGATIPDPVSYTVSLNATASKCKAENKLFLRQEDESDTINAIPKIPGSPPVDYPVSFTVKISSAGQTKVKGA